MKSCSLSLDYWGGVKVYVNGKEVARQHLPKDAANLDAVADDYPVEAFTTPDGKPLKIDDEKNQDRLALRDRTLRDIKIPVSALRKGVNVVAIEVHAAPIHAKAAPRQHGNGPWPPVGLLDARVVVSPPSAAVANARPKGIQIWNSATYQDVTPFDYGDPAEPLRPILVRAARNGVFSGRLMVGSDQPIKGLKVSVAALANAEGGTIPSSAVRVRYAEPAVPAKSWVSSSASTGCSMRFPRKSRSAMCRVERQSFSTGNLIGPSRPGRWRRSGSRSASLEPPSRACTRAR